MAMPIPMPDVVAQYRTELEAQQHPAPTKATAHYFGISDRQVRRLVDQFRENQRRAQRAAALVEARTPPPPDPAAALIEPDAAPQVERTPPSDAAPRQLLRLPSRSSRRQYRARLEDAPQLNRMLPTTLPLLESLLNEPPVPTLPIRPAAPVRPARFPFHLDMIILCAVVGLGLAVVLGVSSRIPRSQDVVTAVVESATMTRTPTPLPTKTASPVPSPTAPPPPTESPTELPPSPTAPLPTAPLPTAPPPTAPPMPVAPTGWCADDGLRITCYNGAAPPPVAPFVIVPTATIAPYQATEQTARCAEMAADAPCWRIWILATPTE